MKIYCINRFDRKDRWKICQDEFKKMNFLNVVRFEAIIGSPGWEGCRDSHLELLKMNCIEKTFLILEDDVAFMPNALENLREAVNQLPKDWDILYLGCNPLEQLEQYSDNLYILKKSYTTHAIMYNGFKAVDFVLSNLEKIRKIDVFYSDIVMEKFKCFVTYPLVAAQHSGFGNICKTKSNYFETITENFSKYTR